MSEHYFVHTRNLETDENTIDGPFSTDLAAIAYAEERAEEFFGGDDVTWYEALVAGQYYVGQMMSDGSRSEPRVHIVIVEEAVESDEE